MAETLTKESVRIMLNSFEEESLSRAIERNLDKINDSNVKDIMKMLSDYIYWNVQSIEERKSIADKIRNTYGLDI